MKEINSLILAAVVALTIPFSVQAEEVPESLKGAPEKYISVSLCIQIAASYYHIDEGVDAIRAVGRASYDCREEIDNYLSLLLENPKILEARLQSSMSVDNALNFLNATQVFEIKQEVLDAIKKMEQ